MRDRIIAMDGHQSNKEACHVLRNAMLDRREAPQYFAVVHPKM
jgi:hypothetical protein